MSISRYESTYTHINIFKTYNTCIIVDLQKIFVIRYMKVISYLQEHKKNNFTAAVRLPKIEKKIRKRVLNNTIQW